MLSRDVISPNKPLHDVPILLTINANLPPASVTIFSINSLRPPWMSRASSTCTTTSALSITSCSVASAVSTSSGMSASSTSSSSSSTPRAPMEAEAVRTELEASEAIPGVSSSGSSSLTLLASRRACLASSFWH